MGNNEIYSYIYNKESFSYLLRILSAQSPKKKKSFLDSLSEYGMDIGMIIAPLITYCFQISKFTKTKSSKGFSKLICFLLFMGNIIRIFFWFGTRFKKTLLYQSIGIVIFQIILIHLCVKYQEGSTHSQFVQEVSSINGKNPQQNLQNESQEKSLIYNLLHWKETFNYKKIWKWKLEIEYYKFMFFIIVILFLLCVIFQNNKIFFHLIGIMSAVFESLICLPQIIENYKTKNSKNVSFTMIFCWFLGDSFRLFYNIKYKAPIQMISAIAVQATFDIIVCIQLIMYRDKGNQGNNKLNISKDKIEDINSGKIDESNLSEKKKNEIIVEEQQIKKKSRMEQTEEDKNNQKIEENNETNPN